jgi:hypothetical protein
MDQQQMTKQISNKTILENTLVLAQTKKLLSRFLEKAPWFQEAEKKIINKPGGIYKNDCENLEVSTEYIMALYKIANQEINSQRTAAKEGQF